MVRVVSSRFLRLSCSDDDHPLFRRYYARSNRERGVKLLRCFPHCCPEHAQRCYCGTSVHVLVGFAAEVDAARQANLLVCARFEPSRVVPLWPVGVVPAPGCGGDADEAPNQEHERKLQPGEIVWLPEGVLAGGKSRAEQSVWIRADREGQVKQEALPKNEVLYVLNNHRFPKWLYNYDSSVTKTQREMTHHLVVYVFQRADGPQSRPGEAEAAVLARLESPGFSLISYRRSGNNASDAGCDLPAIQISPSSSSSFSAVDVDVDAPAFASAPEAMEVDSAGRSSRRLQSDELEAKYEAVLEQSAASRLGSTRSASPGAAPSSDHSQRDFWLYEARAQHSGLAEKAKHLLILWRFLSCVSLADAGVTPDVLSAQIRSHWLRAAAALRASPEGRAAQLEGVMSAFLLSLCRGAPPLASDGAPPRDQLVLQAAAHLLLRALSSRAVQYALQSAITVDAGELDTQQLRERFVDLVVDMYDILGDLLQLGSAVAATALSSSSVTVPALVDDVLSLVYSQQRFALLRGDVSALLMGHRASHSPVETVERLFQAFAAQVQELSSTSGSGPQLAALETALRSAASAGASCSPWSRRWLLDPGSIRAASIPQAQEVSVHPSLVEFSRWIYELACVDLAVRDDGSWLSVRSLLPMLGGMAATELLLDGRLRAFRATPGGVSAMVPAPGGWSIGEYAASFSERTDTLTLDLYALKDSSLAVSANNTRRREWLDGETHMRCISMTLVLEEQLAVEGVQASVDPQDCFIFFRGVVSHAIHSDTPSANSWDPQPKLADMSAASRSVAFRELQWEAELELQGGYVAVPT